jgi:hypothetical protein
MLVNISHKKYIGKCVAGSAFSKFNTVTVVLHAHDLNTQTCEGVNLKSKEFMYIKLIKEFIILIPFIA